MLLERPLVRQQLIQRAVETLVVDPLARQPQQVFQRALTVPIFSNVQFAGRFGQARDYQHRRHLGPRDRFLARWHQLCAQFVQLERAPQLPSQPDPAEPARTLDAHSIEPDRYALLLGRESEGYQAVMHGMMPFIDLANETGCHIMLLHHTGKADGEGGDAVIDSEGYFGSVDTLLILKEENGIRNIHSIQRVGEELPRTILTHDKETNLVDCRDDGLTIDEKTVLDTIDALGGEPKQDDVLKRAGIKRANGIGVLKRLEQRGTILRFGKPMQIRQIAGADNA